MPTHNELRELVEEMRQFYDAEIKVELKTLRGWIKHGESLLARAPAESREAAMVVVERSKDGTPTVWCDPEIESLVRALNSSGIKTVASCSGHGERFGNIALCDGREQLIAPNCEAARDAERKLGMLPVAPVVNQGLTARAQLSDIERRCLESVRSNAEHEAGDVHDTAPSMKDDEDAYWAYHTYWAVNKALDLVIVPTTECPTCEKDGVWATDGAGPFDCYDCGRKASPAAPVAEEIAGESELDYRRRQMKAVWDFLRPNESNDMDWADEIIIAIQNRAPAVEVDEASVLRACLHVAVGDDPSDWEDADGVRIGGFLVPALNGDIATARAELARYHEENAAALGREGGGNG